MALSHKLLLTFWTAWLFAPSCSDAQAVPGQFASQGNAASEGTGLEEIMVTATRRTANLQEVPETVTVVSSDTLESLNIKTVVDLPDTVSGLTVNRLGAAANSFLRGVGANSVGFTTESPIAVYIDGFYLPYASSAAFSFNNIDSVEVLKGPQGTLYGRNATGGLINVLTRDPSQQPHLDASLEYANYDTLYYNFYGSAPISNTLSANLAVVHTNQNEGWGRNVVTGNANMTDEETGLMAKVLWKPTSRTTATFHAFYDELDSDQGAILSIHPGSVATDGTRDLGDYLNASRLDPYVYVHTYDVGAKVEQDLGFADFLSLTGYLHTRTASTDGNTGGSPGNPVAGQAAVWGNNLGVSNTFTQEFQLRSNRATNSRFEWILGAFYFHDDTEAQSAGFPTCNGDVCAPSPIPTLVTGYPTTRSYAGYGEGTLKFSDRTRLTLGVRYTDDKRGLTGRVQPLAGFPNSVAALPPSVVLMPGAPYPGNPNGIPISVSFSKVTDKAVLAQDITDNIHSYVSYNRGFRSGGYSPVGFTNEPAEPEVLDAYEIGLKSELFDRLLRLNLAGFYYDYKDIQLRTTAPPAPPGGSILYNAAAAHIKGVDADFELVPTRLLSFVGSLEYLDAKYTSFPDTTCTAPRAIGGSILGGNFAYACDNSGHWVINAPKLSFTLGAAYKVQTDVGEFALTANDKYTSTFFWDPDNRLRQTPYHLLNASLDWTAQSKSYDVQLFVKNLTNKYYSVYVAEGTNDSFLPGAPRTYGIALGYHY